MRYDNIKYTLHMDGYQIHILRASFGKIDWVIPMHHHSDNSYEIHYIKSGRGTVIINGEHYNVVPNILYVVGPLVNHEQIPEEEDPMIEYCINICIDKEPDDSDTSMFIKCFVETDIFFGQDTQDASSVMQLIYRELAIADSGSRYAVIGIFQYLFVLLSRLYDETSMHLARQTPLLPQTVQFCLIEDAFLFEYKNLTMELLSKRMGMSVRQTERLLKRNYGSTFRQMKQKARMAAATVLVKTSGHSVAEIAEEVGYSSVEHFCRAFKSYYGKSVNDYRINSKEKYIEKQ